MKNFRKKDLFRYAEEVGSFPMLYFTTIGSKKKELNTGDKIGAMPLNLLPKELLPMGDIPKELEGMLSKEKVMNYYDHYRMGTLAALLTYHKTEGIIDDAILVLDSYYAKMDMKNATKEEKVLLKKLQNGEVSVKESGIQQEALIVMHFNLNDGEGIKYFSIYPYEGKFEKWDKKNFIERTDDKNMEVAYHSVSNWFIKGLKEGTKMALQ